MMFQPVSATTEECHSQQLMQVKQVPQVHVNAAFPQSLAAVMFSSLRFKRTLLGEGNSRAPNEQPRKGHEGHWSGILEAHGFQAHIWHRWDQQNQRVKAGSKQAAEHRESPWNLDPKSKRRICLSSVSDPPLLNAPRHGLQLLTVQMLWKFTWHSFWILKLITTQRIPEKNEQGKATEVCKAKTKNCSRNWCLSMYMTLSWCI